MHAFLQTRPGNVRSSREAICTSSGGHAGNPIRSRQVIFTAIIVDGAVLYLTVWQRLRSSASILKFGTFDLREELKRKCNERMDASEEAMPTVNVNGCDLYYEIHGQGDPLMMIMGLRRNIEWWYHQIPTLSKHFMVIVFDNRGAGRSEKPATEYSIQLFADDTAALMEALDIDHAHVLGISMGGYIAQELAIHHPQKVTDLVLGCTSCGGKKAVMMSDDRLKKFTANKNLTPEEILRKDMDIYFSDEYIANNKKAVAEFSDISMRYYQPADAFVRQFAACLKHDTTARLNRIYQPTLIMTGDDDPLVPPENSFILKELLPEARLSVFPRGRHCFFMEFADRFNREVMSHFTVS